MIWTQPAFAQGSHFVELNTAGSHVSRRCAPIAAEVPFSAVHARMTTESSSALIVSQHSQTYLVILHHTSVP